MIKTIYLIPLFLLFTFSTLADNAVVLNYTIDINVKGKQLITQTFLKIQVNNPNGDKYVGFKLNYSKKFKLNGISGKIFDLAGNRLHKLSKKEIKVSSAFYKSTFYSDHFVKKFTLKHNKYPYIIECRYTYKTSSFIQITDWSPVWDTDITTQNAQLTFTCPDDYKYKLRSREIDPPISKKVVDGQQTTRWKSSYTNKKFDNVLMPPIDELLPHLLIVPLNFNYITNGNFASWKSFGQYYTKITEGLDELTQTEKETIDQLCYQITDTTQLINTLYHYMQDNTRYVDVSIKFGGLLTYPANYVCNKKFGDCKALSNYMKALLHYKGIEAQPALVVAGNNPEPILTDFPSQQFNHVILCIPRNDTIWLECTAKTFPTNYLGAFTQNRPVLLINGEQSKLVKTPVIKPEEATNIFSYNFYKPNEKTVEVNYKTALRTNNFENIRGVATYKNDRDIEDYIAWFIDLPNVKVNTWQIEDQDRGSSYLILNSKLTCTTPYETIGAYLKIKHPPFKLPKFEPIPDRKFDVRITSPMVQTDTICYTHDFKGLMFNSNESELFESPFGTYHIERSITDHRFIVIRHIVIPTQTIKLCDYPEFYQFYTNLNDASLSTLFTPK